jgi:oligopeptide transport system ATP-binding protein
LYTPLVEINDLKVYYPNGKNNPVRAVDGVSLDIYPGETLGLVGESGCGKSTLARAILRLYEPTAGEVLFDGKNIFNLSPQEMKDMRREMQIVFQDPYASLNPRRTVGQIIGLPMALQGVPRKEIRERVQALLPKVGLQETHIDRYPHQFSGGQRQRIGIARALAVGPRFIVADEPVSSLDVSIRAQIINLLQELQQEMGLTFLFITHDLSVVNYVSDRIAVMYLGKIVELASTTAIFASPRHPYTQALLSAIPRLDGRHRRRIILRGSVPSPMDPPSGCRFRTRCFHRAKDDACLEEPPLMAIGDGHYVACHYAVPSRQWISA